MPMSSRFDPVMFASASGAYSSGFLPAFHANVKSTAYSGNTAMSARTASARPCDTSSWRTSAAQARRNADPRMAAPKTNGATQSPGDAPLSRMSSPGSVVSSAPAMASTDHRERGPPVVRAGSAWGAVTRRILRGVRAATWGTPGYEFDRFGLRTQGISAEALIVATMLR